MNEPVRRYRPHVEETHIAWVWVIVDLLKDDVIKMGAATWDGAAWQEMEYEWEGLCIQGVIDPEETFTPAEDEPLSLWGELKKEEG